MRLLVLPPFVLLISVLACQSGSGGTGVLTSGGEGSGTEPGTNADLNQDEDRARTANRAAREEAKLHEAAEERYRRAAVERDREAQERWRAGAGERLQADAERARQRSEAQEDVPPRQPQ